MMWVVYVDEATEAATAPRPMPENVQNLMNQFRASLKKRGARYGLHTHSSHIVHTGWHWLNI